VYRNNFLYDVPVQVKIHCQVYGNNTLVYSENILSNNNENYHFTKDDYVERNVDLG